MLTSVENKPFATINNNERIAGTFFNTGDTFETGPQLAHGVEQQKSDFEQLSGCLRDLLRQFFPKQTVWGKEYSPIDDAKFRPGIPGWMKAASYLPGVVTPAAITLGLYDIHYDTNEVNISGGRTFNLATVIEEVAHTEQFLQVWANLPNETVIVDPSGAEHRYSNPPSYERAQRSWAGTFLKEAVKSGFSYDNKIEQDAKAKVDSIINKLRSSAAPNQSQVCGFNLYDRYK